MTVAKKIAKDMEKWAKTLNQRKESAKVAVQPPAAAAAAAEPEKRREPEVEAGKSSLHEVLHVANLLQRKEFVEKKPVETLVATYGSDSDSDHAADNKKTTASVDSLIDWVKLACLLCKRQFSNKETLVKHQKQSDLHKQNLESWKMQNMPANYRDRAKERRQKFGDTETPSTSSQSRRYKVC